MTGSSATYSLKICVITWIQNLYNLHTDMQHPIHKIPHVECVICMPLTLHLKNAQNNLGLGPKMRKTVFLKGRHRKPTQKQTRSLEAKWNLFLPLYTNAYLRITGHTPNTRLVVNVWEFTEHLCFLMLLSQLYSLFKNQGRTICGI